MSNPSPKDVALALLKRRRSFTAYTVKAPDGRFYFDFANFLAWNALEEFFVFETPEKADKVRRREGGSEIVPVKVTIEIEED
jgi:hypothetical protein